VTISFIAAAAYLETGLCIAALCILIAKRQLGDYRWLCCFLAVRVLSEGTLAFAHGPFRHFVNINTAYDLYFSVYWISFAIESILALMVVYSVFKLAMAPLKGLQTLGMLIFKWAAGISVAVALSSAFSPSTTAAGHISGLDLLVNAISELQRTQSVLTLCLLLFVFFAIRPMGLSYSSRIFGVSLGLAIMSANDLIQSAWLALNPSMHTTYNRINGIIICVILGIWTTYFAVPEPKRRMIVLPTTSPFLRWNQISQALGDDPGFVAVGGVPPEMFATAELEVMRRASLKMPAPVAEFPVSSLSEERLSASRAI
jgi:hypothetical protein